MRKKILCGALLTMMCFSMAACGDNKSNDTSTVAPTTSSEIVTEADSSNTSESGSTEATSETEAMTAESLMNNFSTIMASHKDEVLNLSLDVNMTLKGQVQEGSQEMEIPFALTGTCKFAETAAYMDTKMDMDMGAELGGKQTYSTQSYAVKEDNGQIMSYSTSDGTNWTKSVADTKSTNFIDNIDTSIFSDLSMSETETEYVVTGKTNSANLGGISSIVGTSGNSEVVMNIYFDKSTKDFIKIDIDFSQLQSNMGLTVSECKFNIINTGFTKETIEVPADVISKAVAMDESLPIVEVDNNNENATVEEVTEAE